MKRKVSPSFLIISAIFLLVFNLIFFAVFNNQSSVNILGENSGEYGSQVLEMKDKDVFYQSIGTYSRGITEVKIPVMLKNEKISGSITCELVDEESKDVLSTSTIHMADVDINHGIDSFIFSFDKEVNAGKPCAIRVHTQGVPGSLLFLFDRQNEDFPSVLLNEKEQNTNFMFSVYGLSSMTPFQFILFNVLFVLLSLVLAVLGKKLLDTLWAKFRAVDKKKFFLRLGIAVVLFAVPIFFSYFFNNGVFTDRPVVLSEEKGTFTKEITSGTTLVQSFVGNGSSLKGVSIITHTYEGEAQGTLVLKLLDESGRTLAIAEASNATLPHDNPALLYFDQQVKILKNEKYQLEITSPGTVAGKGVAVHCSKEDAYGGELTINGDGTAGDLSLTLVTKFNVFQSPVLYLIFFVYLLGVITLLLNYQRFYKMKYMVPIILLLYAALFFCYSPIFTWDSVHYLGYLKILSGQAPLVSWDPVRGPSFILILRAITGVFGRSVVGFLIFQLGMILLTLFCYYRLLKKVFHLEKEESRVTLFWTMMVFIGMNPIVFGYYHSVLTEFVAATAFAVLIYVTYELFHRIKNGVYDWKFYGACCVYAAMFPFLYFLKQPFIIACLAVSLVLILLSFVQMKGLKKRLVVFGLIAVSVLSLFSSLTLWNQFLPDSKSDYFLNRTSDSIFKRMFAPGSDYIRYIKGEEWITLDNLDDYEAFLSPEEKEILERKDKEYTLTVVKDSRDVEVVDAYFLPFSDPKELSTLSSVRYFFGNLLRNPGTYFSNYLNNYFANCNFYETYSYDTVGYFVNINTPSLFRANENLRIGYYTFYPAQYSNVYYVIPSMEPDAANLSYKMTPAKEINSFFTGMFKISNFAFTVSNLLLPFVWLFAVVYVFLKKNCNKGRLLLLLSSVSFLNNMLNCFCSTMLDRYLFVGFAMNLLSLALVGNILWKKGTEIVRKKRTK